MDVKLPKLGEGADSGIVVNLFVKEGDTIAKDQAIMELENEKAVASIPSTAAGVVSRVYVKAGDRISAGQKILTVGGDAPAAAAPAAAPKPAAKKAAAQAAPEPETVEEESADIEEEVSSAEVATSPSIRKMAHEFGIHLGKIRGSGAGGRIISADVRAYIQRLMKAAAKPAAAAAAPAKPAAVQIDFSQWGPILKKPVSPLRKVIARRMSESWNSVARVTQFDDIDFTRVGELRKKYAPAYEAKGVKLTLTPFVLNAVAGTLRKHSIFNSSLDEVAQRNHPQGIHPSRHRGGHGPGLDGSGHPRRG